MIDYILSLTENVIIFQGIRMDESLKRSKMNEQCRQFKYYFEPYSSNKITISELFPKRHDLTPIRKAKLIKAINRLKQGKLDEKYFTYRKNDVFEWCKKYSDDLIRPFFNESANYVIHYCLNRDYKINPLYFKGASRVGCFPCKNANHDEMKLIINDFPDTLEKIRQAEYYVNGTFFGPNYIPERYHTGFDEKSQKSICTIDDVVRYLTDKNSQYDLLEDFGFESSKCKSVYAICE